eukprot:6871358-Prymnesium_polylepis.1
MSSLDRDIAYPYASLVAMLVRHAPCCAQHAPTLWQAPHYRQHAPIAHRTHRHEADHTHVTLPTCNPTLALCLVRTQVKMVMVIQSIVAGMTMARYSDGSAKVYVCAGIFVYTLAFQ